jgi:hypothetical protein
MHKWRILQKPYVVYGFLDTCAWRWEEQGFAVTWRVRGAVLLVEHRSTAAMTMFRIKHSHLCKFLDIEEFEDV